MKYYTYKVTFKDLPGYFYYGKHKDNGKPYFGSPKTWRRLWSLFEPEVQVLQWYKTAKEVGSAEKAIIRATWDDKYSLNENAGGSFSEEVCRKNGKKTGPDTVKAMLDHPNTKESQKCEAMNSHPGTLENQRKQGKANGAKTGATNGRSGLAKMPRETRVANGKATGSANGKSNGPANGKAATSQRWQCLVTGHVSNPGALSNYQKSRGIDTSLRVKLTQNN